jgi:hypothetical protein
VEKSQCGAKVQGIMIVIVSLLSRQEILGLIEFESTAMGEEYEAVERQKVLTRFHRQPEAEGLCMMTGVTIFVILQEKRKEKILTMIGVEI